jgi:LAO/AO transport system kinase
MLNNQPADFFIEGILKGDVAVLSRAITLVESQNEEYNALGREITDKLLRHSGNSFRLGVTGVPGVGKSTFIESFGMEVLKNGHKLAVLAVDPSSSLSKGSILGDKTRMEKLSTQKNAYIRPSPAGGNLGGVTRSTYETILLCEAAGFDYIIIETVGVGQSETSVSRITDFFLLLMLAGAGDELQGIKRGIMEMADSVVITKADSENLDKAKAARAEYAHAMHMLQTPESGWVPRILTCSAINNSGIPEIFKLLEEYKAFAVGNNYFEKRRKEQLIGILKETLDHSILKKFYYENNVIERLKSIALKNFINPFKEVDEFINPLDNSHRNKKNS